MTSVAFDMGHLILTGLVGIVVFFLQRELSRNDNLRTETLGLISDVRAKMEGHERRINDHGNKQAVQGSEVAHLTKEVSEIRADVRELQRGIAEKETA